MHGEVPGAVNIPIRQVLDRLGEIPTDRSILVFCTTGRRSMMVASLLGQRGWDELSVVLGGLTE
jgi:rhodanese-related sulfurtransferase